MTPRGSALYACLLAAALTGASPAPRAAAVAGLPPVDVLTDCSRPRGAPPPAYACDPALGPNYVQRAIEYLWRSRTARAMFARLARSPIPVHIVLNANADDEIQGGPDGSAVVFWDPRNALRARDGTVSPALLLAHELFHAVHAAEDPGSMAAAGRERDRDFNDREERRTILYGENPVARELGETVRRGHAGAGFTVSGPADRGPSPSTVHRKASP